MPSIFDNLLQQRPLLVGLPVFAFVLLLLRDMSGKNRLLLAGVMTGLLFEFHNVGFLCCYIAFVAAIIFNYKQFKLTNCLYFLLPTALALPFIFHNGPPATISLSTAFLSEFANVGHDPLLYYLLNLGIPFVIALVSFVKRGNEVLKGTMLFLVLIPNILLITPNPWDMYKFFIFAWIPIAVLAGVMLQKPQRS